MPQKTLILLAALLALTAGCASNPEEGPGSRGPDAAPNGGDAMGGDGSMPGGQLPVPEDSRERTERLRRIENALDLWYVASQKQEYARRDGLENHLRTYTNENFEKVVSDLETGNQRYRRAAAGALGFSKRPEAVAPLTASLRDEYYEVVLHSLLSLYHLASEGITFDPELVAPYLQHPRPEVRSNAALAISKVVGPESAQGIMLPLLSALEDKDAATRVHAIAAIGAMRNADGFPHLVKALHDPVQLVRIRAILALGRVGLPEAMPFLVELLERGDETTEAKKAAAKVLGAMTGRPEMTSREADDWEPVVREVLAGLEGR